MGFLLLSVEYPSDTHKTKYSEKAGPHSNFVSPFHKFLAASATDDQWRRVLRAIRDTVTDSSFLHDQTSPRPLKPNDDNYQVHTRSFSSLQIFEIVWVIIQLLTFWRTSCMMFAHSRCQIKNNWYWRPSPERNGNPRTQNNRWATKEIIQPYRRWWIMPMNRILGTTAAQIAPNCCQKWISAAVAK